MVVRGSAWLAASWTSRSGTPASNAAVMNAWRSVWSDSLADIGVAGDAPHDPRCAVAIESLAISTKKDRPLGTFTNDQIDRSRSSGRECDGDVFATFAVHEQGAVTSFQPESFDIGPDRF
jgi:hypothetical protein